jgi:hypothetical protein
MGVCAAGERSESREKRKTTDGETREEEKPAAVLQHLSNCFKVAHRVAKINRDREFPPN